MTERRNNDHTKYTLNDSLVLKQFRKVNNVTLRGPNATIVDLPKNPAFTRSCLKAHKDSTLLLLYQLVICLKTE